MEVKLLKRVIATLCAGTMSMFGMVTSVGAIGDTKEAEVAFSLKYLEAFPKEGSEEFKKFSEPVDTSRLNDSRKEIIKHSELEGSNPKKLSEWLEPDQFNRYKRFFNKHSGKQDECVDVAERKVYADIESTVRELEKKVDDRTPESDMAKKTGKVTTHPEIFLMKMM